MLKFPIMLPPRYYQCSHFHESLFGCVCVCVCLCVYVCVCEREREG